MKDTRWIAANALRNLDERGWNKGAGEGKGGEWCMAYAMHANCSLIDSGILTWPDLTRAHIEAARVIDGLFPERARLFASVPWFNDHPDTTEEDVRLVLKFLAEGE
jgi:hypothetical protein